MTFRALRSLTDLKVGDKVYYKLFSDNRDPVSARVASLPIRGAVSVVDITLEHAYEYVETNYSQGETIVAAEWDIYERE